MIPCSEANRPISANSDRIAATSLLGRIARNPSSSGSPASPIAEAPTTAGLSTSTRPPLTISVTRPHMPARGMSRAGMCDSSAASGSSSMPR